MAEAMLRHPYPTVEKGGDLAWGGNQGWLKAPLAQKYGCGVVAATDLLLYLHRYGEGWGSGYFRDLPEGAIPWEIYDFYADRLRKRYFPLIPPFGLNTLLLAGGLNRYFREYQLPLRAGRCLLAESGDDAPAGHPGDPLHRPQLPLLLAETPAAPLHPGSGGELSGGGRDAGPFCHHGGDGRGVADRLLLGAALPHSAGGVRGLLPEAQLPPLLRHGGDSVRPVKARRRLEQ